MTEKLEVLHSDGTNHIQRMPVPGGWIYIYRYWPPSESQSSSVTMVFVPYPSYSGQGGGLTSEDRYYIEQAGRRR